MVNRSFSHAGKNVRLSLTISKKKSHILDRSDVAMRTPAERRVRSISSVSV